MYPPDTGRDQTWLPRRAAPDLLSPTIHIWRVDLDITPAQERHLSGLLGDAEQERAGRLKFAAHRRRFIASHAGLRLLLGGLLDEVPEAIAFTAGLHGKPALGGRHAAHPLQFNMTHSHELALIAAGTGQPLGVDVEQLRPIPEATGIASRFYSPDEQARFAPVAGTEQEESAFFACWTRKEAIIKCLGQGFQHPTQTFSVAFLPDEPVEILDDGTPGGPLRDWFLVDLQPGTGYAGALAAARPAPVRRWSWVW